ncbi:MAG TPA: NYN domain-containing protein, partial [Bacteroidia bacterium]|nr:NYN domain-containing protein [Bacteroidia bacterium]
MAQNTDNKIALLIDGDNAQSKFIEAMLSEAGKHGKVTVRRIYGDWTDNKLNSWKEKINKYAVRPMQKFAFAKGKNSTDTAMIIDAMDILYSDTVTGFCIASSDSDYTGLAQRIRENGIFVMGIGEAQKTTEAFVNACDLFVFTENLIDPAEAQKKKADEKPRTLSKPETTRGNPKSKIETATATPVNTPVVVKQSA